ncbi:carboxypeptidase-like regulatory domain-containing protein [Dyadobacter sp. 676]|uniref:Carboxypeptidase-like regulatory domain-containing protein n=1 Tax=Dyadobacter sp. 676 TaxID=3088362 RepID=A0AAU8FJD5_9BACT
MTKKLFLSLTFLYFVVTKVLGQNGTISGFVRTSDGEPVELVTVNVNGTAKGALTDRNGKYLIRKIEPGLHRLVAWLPISRYVVSMLSRRFTMACPD